MFVRRWFGDTPSYNLYLARMAYSLTTAYAIDADAKTASAGQKRLILSALPSSTYRLKIDTESRHSLLIPLPYSDRSP